MEFDDLNNKSREAEKEVNMLQIKIQEVNNNLSKLHKDMECKFFFFFFHSSEASPISNCRIQNIHSHCVLETVVTENRIA